MTFQFEDINENPILKKVRENQFNKSYSLVTTSTSNGSKSQCILTQSFQNYADKIKQFKIHNEDTWVISFPKAGTTWAQEMIWLICNNLDYKGAEKKLDDRFPFIEFGAIAKPELCQFDLAENMPNPRFIKSHLPYSFLPNELWAVKPNIVYVARKVKDVCVSYYYHHCLVNNYSGSFEDFVEAFLADLVLWSPFHKHVLDFYNLRNEKNVLFLIYEEMKSDLEAEVRKTIKFFGKSYNDEEIKKLCNHLSFKSMKENKAINKEEIIKHQLKLTGREKDEDKHQFIRKGKVDGWKDDLTEELAERFDNWTKSKVTDPKLLSLFI